MTKKITFTKSIQRNKVAPSCTNLFSSTTQNSQEFSLSKAVKKIAHEVNKTLDHGYSREDLTTILSFGDAHIESIREVQSNHNISNIAIELLPKSEAFTEDPHFHVMASYNDSNRVPDHATRWNSK
jgi:F0F1-type ATP synthase beta subunit